MAIKSSSKDYNQSVHRTVYRDKPKFFWSCAGSQTMDADETLDYKFPIFQ